MTRFCPYPTYKASGISWLGEIPKHWETKRLKFISKINPSKSEIMSLARETEVSYLPMELVENGYLRLEQTKPLEDVWQVLTFFRNGDIIVAKITPCFENGKGALAGGLSNGIGFGTTELHIIRPGKSTDSKFLYYLTLSHQFRGMGAGIMYGTAGQKRVPDSFVINFLTPVPPLLEQRSIAAFLDRHTDRIDALIAKKQRLVDLLHEKRQAIISQAVTRGLNPDAPMKDMDIPWLRGIPEHWEAVHLRRVINKFVDYRGKTPEKVDDGVPLITARNIKNGRIDWGLSQEYISEDEYTEWMVRGFPEVGDVLVTTEAPLGEIAQIIDTDIALAQRIILLKADKERITNEYLKYYLASLSGQGELWSRATGSTAIGIKAYHLKEIWMCVPPLREQQEITPLLDHEENQIFSLLAKIETAIERLREYRSALISAVVTGKIDVRVNAPVI